MTYRHLVRKRPENWVKRVRKRWPERPKWLVYENMHLDDVVIAGFPTWGEAFDYAYRRESSCRFDDQVEVWHARYGQSESAPPLHEFLGLSRERYAQIVERGF